MDKDPYLYGIHQDDDLIKWFIMFYDVWSILFCINYWILKLAYLKLKPDKIVILNPAW